MAGTKITDLPVSNTAENANLIANVNGQATQIPASTVGAQPDWNETDETKPSFILNKPVIEPGQTHYVLSKWYKYTDSQANTDFFVLYKDMNNVLMDFNAFISDYQKGPIFFDLVGEYGNQHGSPCLGVVSCMNSNVGSYPIVYALSASQPITPYVLAYNTYGKILGI